jgi:hypothetical protein
MSTPEDIDRLLAEPKVLAGRVVWVRDERAARAELAAPVLVDGVVGALVFKATATLNTDPQRGSCVLIFEGRPVQRLSHRSGHVHLNPPSKSVDRALRGARLPPDLTRVHLCSLNRVWPRPEGDNLPVGQVLDPQPISLAESLANFLALSGIRGDLPAAPWEPTLL